ncbi:unnamed protein product, partial [Urochloa humidicola]
MCATLMIETLDLCGKKCFLLGYFVCLHTITSTWRIVEYMCDGIFLKIVDLELWSYWFTQ